MMPFRVVCPSCAQSVEVYIEACDIRLDRVVFENLAGGVTRSDVVGLRATINCSAPHRCPS